MRRGPLLMIAAGLMLTIMVALVKTARAQLGPLDLMFWRGASALPLAYLIARPAGFGAHNKRLLSLRIALGFAAMIGYFTAAKGLGLAELSLIAKFQPIVVALLAGLFLGRSERPGPAVWLVVLLGFGGTSLVLAPSLKVGSVYGLWALGGACVSAGAHLCLRALSRTDDARTIVFYFQTAVMVLSFFVIVAMTGGLPRLPPSQLWLHIIGIGVFATAGQMLMTYAYALDRASIVAAASYTAPLFALAGDAIVFAIIPAWPAIAGGIILIGAGLYLLLLPDPGEPIARPAPPDSRRPPE